MRYPSANDTLVSHIHFKTITLLIKFSVVRCLLDNYLLMTCVSQLTQIPVMHQSRYNFVSLRLNYDLAINLCRFLWSCYNLMNKAVFHSCTLTLSLTLTQTSRRHDATEGQVPF